jgi:ABC-type multidrug transport system fused ATPase/permease subunit
MKKQIRRLSPHQNGKVFGILMAVASLVFVVPMFLIMLFVAPAVDQHGNPVIFPKFLIIVFPILYLVFGYVATAIGSAIYNFLYNYIGGFEFEVEDKDV